MPDGSPPPRWFYRSPQTQEVKGPFELIELAGFLTAGDIDAETPIRSENAEDWQPFRKRREYQTAKDIPLGVIMRHLDQEKEDEDEKRVLTPTHIYYFFWVFGGLVLYILSLIFLPHRHRYEANEWLLTLYRLLSFHSNSGN